ncbi:Asp-tRNA(Asn)/Glu-tRNA(Gln) amidotransferase subunit GatC [Candidatus Uhrbacteria bacterium]|nr:Asp-tRNA(Asn)/Glu-tRNA(Gln) amidotransferase subunit GatC [Candidatus Uhrbacteria bacterium]
MALTNDDVLHLAKLCRIHLKPEEVERFAVQLSSILEYVGQLRDVEVDPKDAVANITGLENIMRDDELRACTPEERERILTQFPMREGDLLKTRGVFSA